MTGLFSTVLNMSLIGSFTAAAVLLIRWFLKGRTPRWISYALWAVVLIRLLVPVSFSAACFPCCLPTMRIRWAQAGGFPGWNGV